MALLTSKEVQEKYNISRTTLFRLEKKGLPFIGVGRSKRYEENIIEQWFDNESKGIKQLEVGKIYDNLTIAEVFGCGIQGGMRRAQTTNTLVIFSDHTKGLYEDKWIDNNIILYKGIEQSKNNRLASNLNKTLYESKQNGVSVHLFEIFVPGEYIYRGQVELVDTHELSIQEQQLNEDIKISIFPLKLKVNTPIPMELIEYATNLKNTKAKKMSDDELIKRAELFKEGGCREVITNRYCRNVYALQYTLRRADGICDLCNCEAPFKDKNNNPYLEVHHIKSLSDGGLDSIDNSVALCPTCHRKLHVLNSKEDQDKLLEKIKNHTKSK